MAVKALVQSDGRIAQIEPIGGDFSVALPLAWITVPDGTTTQDTWNGVAVVKFVPPPPPGPDVQLRNKLLDLAFILTKLIDQ